VFEGFTESGAVQNYEIMGKEFKMALELKRRFEGKPYCLAIYREPCSLPVLQNYMELPNAKEIRFQVAG